MLRRAWNRLENLIADPHGHGLANLAGIIAIAAILYGGYSLKWPLRDSLLLASTVLLSAALCLRHYKKPVPLHRSALWLAVLFVVVPLIQLIPLPPAIWSILPGHEPAASVYGAAEIDTPWLPISVIPQATREAAAALGFPLAFFLLGAILPLKGAERFLSLVAIGLGLNLILGAAQMLAPGVENLQMLAPGEDIATGFFENPNHFGFACALLIIIMPVVLGPRVAGTQSTSARLAYQFVMAAIILIVVAIGVGSGSRAAIILSLLALGFWGMEARNIFKARMAGSIFVGAGLAIALLYFAAELTGTLKDSFLSGEQRPLIWSSSLSLALDHLPFGAGVGAFEPAYLVHEPPETILEAIINEAHNLYLQTFIEWGLAGFVLMALAVSGAMRAYRIGFTGGGDAAKGLPGSSIARPQAEGQGRMMRICLAILMLWAIHGLVDYPEQTMALGIILAFALGCALNLVPTGEAARPIRSAHPSSRPRIGPKTQMGAARPNRR